MKRITLTCIATCLTVAGIDIGNLHAEMIKTGFLVMEGQELQRPYDVEVVNDKVLVNGIQTYPHVPNPREDAELKTQRAVRDLLNSLHEQFIEREGTEGHEKARQWLKTELAKHPEYKNHSVRETSRGVEVNLTGVDAPENVPFMRYMRTDNRPRAKEAIATLRERLRENYGVWRKRHGKHEALKQLEEAMKQESLVEEVHVHPDESYSVRWRGSPDMEHVRMSFADAPNEGRDKETPLTKRARFEAEEIARPLRQGLCVIVIEGGAYVSFDGEVACKDFVAISSGKLSDGDVKEKLDRHFRGSQRNILRHLHRNQRQ